MLTCFYKLPSLAFINAKVSEHLSPLWFISFNPPCPLCRESVFFYNLCLDITSLQSCQNKCFSPHASSILRLLTLSFFLCFYCREIYYHHVVGQVSSREKTQIWSRYEQFRLPLLCCSVLHSSYRH